MSDGRGIGLLSGRDDVRAAVLRLAALAGAEVEVVTASTGVRALWQSARVVVVGSDLAAATAAARLPRRTGVVVATTTDPDQALWRSTVELGAARLVVLPGDEQDLVELMSDAIESAPLGGPTIAVVGGCGGAGASTFAAALALTSARTGRTLLIDGDPHGGGLDVLLGEESRPGARWPDLAGARGRLGAAALTDALPQLDGLSLLSWGRAPTPAVSVDATAAIATAAARGFPTVVVDLPRRLDPASTVLATAAELVVLVVPATVRATAAAATVAGGLLSECAQLALVVRDPGSGRLTVGEVAGALGLSVLAALHSEPAVAAAAVRGEHPLRRWRGSLYDACRAVLAAATTAPAAA